MIEKSLRERVVGANVTQYYYGVCQYMEQNLTVMPKNYEKNKFTKDIVFNI